jgi:membrane protein required for beta-lactamase induction
MTLIFILIALGLDFFLGGLERYRNYNWITALFYSLEKRLAHYRYWDGIPGLLVVLAIPFFGLLLLMTFCHYWSGISEAVLTLIILIYCLAPEDLDNRLDLYIRAVDENIGSVDVQADNLINYELVSDEENNDAAIIKSALIESHQRVFAVIFWFLILGIVGAMMYRVVRVLTEEHRGVRSGIADTTKDLLNILEWPSTRIMIIGLGLAGSLVDAFSGWKQSEQLSFEVNNDVLADAGMGALQYLPEIEVPGREESYWIGELKSLINRTLIIGLAVLGIMTLSGKLG